MSRRRWVALGGAVVAVALLAPFVWSWLTYPSDRTVEGAYLRVMSAVNRGEPQEFFAYIETRAQHACFTIGDYRDKARRLVLRSYPEPERSRLARQYEELASTSDGAEVFAIYARQRGWLDRLRRDMSGVARIEVQGERATVETARGTRYPFRRRENGIWGLTLFTAELVAEAERAARDYSRIEAAAKDYERAGAIEARE